MQFIFMFRYNLKNQRSWKKKPGGEVESLYSGKSHWLPGTPPALWQVQGIALLHRQLVYVLESEEKTLSRHLHTRCSTDSLLLLWNHRV